MPVLGITLLGKILNTNFMAGSLWGMEDMVVPAYRKWVFRKWDIVYNVVLRVKRINTVYTINYLTIYTIVFNLVNHSCIG